MSEHTNKQFHADIETTRSLFLEMGGLVEAMVRDGMEALASGNTDLVEQVRKREKEVNRLEVDIDERIILLIDVHFKPRSEEHTSELQSRGHLVCRLLLEKKKKLENTIIISY